jgi:hypothetical protein
MTDLNRQLVKQWTLEEPRSSGSAEEMAALQAYIRKYGLSDAIQSGTDDPRDWAQATGIDLPGPELRNYERPGADTFEQRVARDLYDMSPMASGETLAPLVKAGVNKVAGLTGDPGSNSDLMLAELSPAEFTALLFAAAAKKPKLAAGTVGGLAGVGYAELNDINPILGGAAGVAAGLGSVAGAHAGARGVDAARKTYRALDDELSTLAKGPAEIPFEDAVMRRGTMAEQGKGVPDRINYFGDIEEFPAEYFRNIDMQRKKVEARIRQLEAEGKDVFSLTGPDIADEWPRAPNPFWKIAQKQLLEAEKSPNVKAMPGKQGLWSKDQEVVIRMAERDRMMYGPVQPQTERLLEVFGVVPKKGRNPKPGQWPRDHFALDLKRDKN